MRLAAFGKSVIEGSLLLALVGTQGGCKKDPARRYLMQGDTLLRAQQYSKAAEHYRRATEVKPHDEKLWQRRAFALMHAGQIDEAAESLLRTQDFKQDAAAKAEVQRNVAAMYLETQDLDQAEEHLLEAVELEPRDTSSLMWLGEIESVRGGARSTKTEPSADHLEKALGYYDRVLAVEPDSLQATVNKRVAVLKLIRDHAQRQQVDHQVMAVASAAYKRRDAKERAAQHQQSLEELQRHSLQLKDRIAELRRQGKTLQR